jgi:hypothetical protein
MSTNFYHWLTNDERDIFTEGEVNQIVINLRRSGYRVSYDDDGWYLSRREDPKGSPQSFYAIADMFAQL